MTAREVPPAVTRAVSAYDRGVYTLIETICQIMECITPENVGNILLSLPDDLYAELKSNADNAPTNDREWEEAQYVYIGSGLFMSGYERPSAEEESRRTEDWKKQHRVRIEAIREFIAKRNAT